MHKQPECRFQILLAKSWRDLANSLELKTAEVWQKSKGMWYMAWYFSFSMERKVYFFPRWNWQKFEGTCMLIEALTNLRVHVHLSTPSGAKGNIEIALWFSCFSIQICFHECITCAFIGAKHISWLWHVDFILRLYFLV